MQEKIDLSEWNDSLIPYQKFFDKYAPTEWESREESIIPFSLQSRLRIIHERPTTPLASAHDVGRVESLGEMGIYSSEEDSKELAKALVTAVVDNLSKRDIEHVILELQQVLDSW